MGRQGAVIGSKEAVEKASSRSRCFMKYHSLMAAVSDEEVEAQVDEGGPEAKDGSEDDL